MEDKKSFVFYETFYDGLEVLSKDEFEPVAKAILRYGLYGELPDLKGSLLSVFNVVKGNIDIAKARREAAVKNGKKGGRPKKNASEKATKKTAKKPASKSAKKHCATMDFSLSYADVENLNVNENVNVNVNENENMNGDGNVVVASSENAAAPFSYAIEDNNEKTAEEAVLTETDGVGASLFYTNGDICVITKSELDEWGAAYPMLNIRSELDRMQVWLRAHPDRQNSAGAKHFILSWLNGEVNKLRAQSAKPEPKTPQWNDEYEKMFKAAACRGEGSW